MFKYVISQALLIRPRMKRKVKKEGQKEGSKIITVPVLDRMRITASKLFFFFLKHFWLQCKN